MGHIWKRRPLAILQLLFLKQNTHMHAKINFEFNIMCRLALSQCQIVYFNVNYYSFHHHIMNTAKVPWGKFISKPKHFPSRSKCFPKRLFCTYLQLITPRYTTIYFEKSLGKFLLVAGGKEYEQFSKSLAGCLHSANVKTVHLKRTQSITRSLLFLCNRLVFKASYML